MNTKKKNVGAIFLILIIILIAATCVVLAMSLRKDNVAEAISSDQVVRVLFVVEDDEHEALFTNVLIYYPETGRAAVVNIPGKTASIFRSLGRVDSIDTVYKEHGIETYRDEINRLLDIRIPFTAVFTKENFAKFTDLLGGLRLFVSEPVDITDGDGERYLLPSGSVVLDGDKVASYLRYRRETETDNAVYERYQNVMLALFISLKDKHSVIFSGQNFKIFNDCIDVNLNYEDSYNLFSLISGINTEYIIRQSVAGTVRVIGSKSLLYPLNSGEFIKQVISQTTNMIASSSGTMAGRVYVIEVQNGTSVQGLARNTQVLFENAGYEVIRVGNAKNGNDYAQTSIVDHIGNMEAAMMVGDFIHCTNIVEEDVGSSVADKDFTIILGRDFDGRYVRSR